MKIVYSHKLSDEEAHIRIDNKLKELKKSHPDAVTGSKIEWDSSNRKLFFDVKYLGYRTSGQLELKNGQVIVDASIPLLARPFSGQIESKIVEKLSEILS